MYTTQQGVNVGKSVYPSATLSSLKVNISTRMCMVHLKFMVQLTRNIGAKDNNNNSIQQCQVIESNLSYPFIVITNESQWCEAASKLLLSDVFQGTVGKRLLCCLLLLLLFVLSYFILLFLLYIYSVIMLSCLLQCIVVFHYLISIYLSFNKYKVVVNIVF